MEQDFIDKTIAFADRALEISPLQMAYISTGVASLEEAREIIVRAQASVSTGPMYPWKVLAHAESYLDKQITEALKKQLGGE